MKAACHVGGRQCQHWHGPGLPWDLPVSQAWFSGFLLTVSVSVSTSTPVCSLPAGTSWSVSAPAPQDSGHPGCAALPVAISLHCLVIGSILLLPFPEVRILGLSKSCCATPARPPPLPPGVHALCKGEGFSPRKPDPMHRDQPLCPRDSLRIFLALNELTSHQTS